jgi:hypothetical protein
MVRSGVHGYVPQKLGAAMVEEEDSPVRSGDSGGQVGLELELQLLATHGSAVQGCIGVDVTLECLEHSARLGTR